MTVTSGQIVQRLEKEEKTEQEIAFFPEDKKYGRIKKSLDQKESKQGNFLEEKEKAVLLLISVQDTRRKRMLRKQREVMQRELAKQRKQEKTYPKKEICKTEESFTNFFEQKTEDFFDKENSKEELILPLTSEKNNTDFLEKKDFFKQEVVENKNTIKNSTEKNTYDLSEMEIEKRKNEKNKKKILYKKRKQENRQREQKSYQKEKEQKINQKNKEKTSQTEEELKSSKNTEFIKEATNTTNTSDFFPSKKLEALQEKAEKIEKQIEKAQRKLKRKKEYKLTRVWKESSGKASYVLTITRVEKQPISKHLWKQGIHWIESQGNAYIHGKIAEAEQENSAVEAAHKTEQLTETIYGYANSHRKTKEQRQRETLQKLQKKQEKAEKKVSYQQYLEEHPEISKKEIRKRMQKAQRKKEYQKIRHQAERIKEGKETIFKAGDTTIELIRKTQEFAKKHMVAIISMVVFGCLLLMFMTLISSCSLLVGNVLSSSIVGCYLSDPKEIDAAELYLTKLEAELEESIRTIEEEYPEYENYQYSLDPIGHDPFVFLSFLSAVYTEFIFEEIKNEIEVLFTEMYTLTITENVTTTMIPVPVEDEFGNLQYEMIQETIKDLIITLEAKPLEELLLEKMNAEQRELYEVYQETKGGLQQFSSPVEMAYKKWRKSFDTYRGICNISSY